MICSNASSFSLDPMFHSYWFFFNSMNFLSFWPSSISFASVSHMLNLIMHNPLGLTSPVHDTFQTYLRCLIHLYISLLWCFRLHKKWHGAYKLKGTSMSDFLNFKGQNSIHGLGVFPFQKLSSFRNEDVSQNSKLKIQVSLLGW